MSLPGVITQRTSAATPSGATTLDWDDCAVYATFWAAKASRPDLPAPSLTTFRNAAGNPDDPWTDGLADIEVWNGVRKCYPTAGAQHYVSTDWARFAALLKEGWIASLAVLSSELPSNLRFNFYGRHRIGVAYENGAFVVANPLASQGSAPIPCSGTALRNATLALGFVFAVLFPPPTHGDEMDIEAKFERWLLDGGPGRVTTVGAPIVNGKPDYSRRLALTSGTGDTNRTYRLIARDRLTEHSDSLNEPLYRALASYTMPEADCTDEIAVSIAADRAKARIVWG